MFWEHQVLRSSKNPQKVVPNVLQTSGSQLILEVSSNSSKGHQSPRSHQKSTKGIQGDLNSSKRYQRPQNPVVVKSSSNGHQMVLTKSSKVPKNSPQMVHKKSSKVPGRFFNVLRASGPQVFKKSSKVHKVLKKSRKCTKGTQGPQTSGSQLILKMPSNSSKGHQSPRSPHRSTKGNQGDLKSSKRYQRPQNPVVVKSSSNGHQMVLTKSSKFPKNSSQKVHKKSAKGPEKFFNVLRYSGPQAFKKSSKRPQSPQKVRKMHKKVPNVLRPQVLKDTQIVHKVLKIYQRPQFLSR